MAVEMEKNRSIVRVSEDGVEAYLSLCPPEEKKTYSIKDLKTILEQNNVVEGIKEEVLQSMITENLYYMERLVAKGKKPEDGQDGKFEFLFSTVQDKKPKILLDGSVDYGSMQDVTVVEAGTDLVRYIQAIPGINGIDVYGRPMIAKAGRELPGLKVKGVTISEDGHFYTASITGKIEYENDRLTVSNILMVEGDVTILTGDIEFTGDVFVKGNVVSGMTIQAKGSITVNGHVEGAQLIAGKDVILKNGMQGAGKGEVRAGGEVSGKFFEQTTIYAKGCVKANAILNCHIISEQEIIVSGKKGIIVGGSICAIRKIEATIIGNISEVKTRIDLGVEPDIFVHINKVKSKYSYLLEEINRIEQGIVTINKILEKADNSELAEKKLYLIRAKISKDSVVASLQQELRNLQRNIKNAEGAKLVVQKSIYRGTKLNINGCTKLIESENYNVTYYENQGEIVFKQNI